MTFIYSSINTSFIVSDPLGRKTGFDPINQISYKEIPKAQFAIDSTSTPSEPEYQPETLVEQYKYSNIESVENGKHQITLYGIQTGPYSVTVYTHDKDGFRNDGHSFEGQISKGETKLLEFTQLDTALPIFNANLNVLNAFYLDPAGRKVEKFADRFVLHGKTSSKLAVADKVKVTIGGISGYSKQFMSGEFRSTRNKSETLYRLKNNRDANVIVSSNGEFWIYLKDINLDLIQKNKWGDIMIEIDEIYAQTDVSIRCIGRVCYKK